MRVTLKSAELFPILANDGDCVLARYKQLFNHYKEAILEGRIKAGEKLPSSRQLSQQMGISRNSVLNVYEMLCAEGLTETVTGSGTYVAALDEPFQAGDADSRNLATSIQLNSFAQRLDSSIQAVENPPSSTHLLKPGEPALSHFPHKEWTRSLNASVKSGSMFSEQPVMGNLFLREQIAEHLRQTRGVRCSAEQVMITSGSLQALSIITQLLIEPGDQVLIEDTGYKTIDKLLQAAGAKTSPLKTDNEGICTPFDPASAKASKVLIVTPSRSFPLGHTLSIARRLSLLQWASDHQAVIIEDDYDSEFVFKGLPVSALQGLDQQARVIYTGTFSRTLFAGIRLGYLIIPDALIPLFSAYRRLSDGGLTSVVQVAMADFLQRGCYSSHLRRMRKLYKSRKQFLDTLCMQYFPDWQLLESSGGTHSVYLLPDSQSDQVLCERARRVGVELRALSSYARSQPPRNGLVIGYAGFTEVEIEKGVKLLKEILENTDYF